MRTLEKAGGIVLNQHGDILIITNQIGRITLPKGGLEPGETHEQAAIREILEEGGLKNVKIIKELGVITRPGYTEHNSKVPSVIKKIRIYLCYTDEFELKPRVKDIQSAHWVRPDQVNDLLSWEEEKIFINANFDQLIMKS